MPRFTRIAAAALLLSLTAPTSAHAAPTEYIGPVCNGRYQQYNTIAYLYTYTNWTRTYYANGTIRFSYDKYVRSNVDIPVYGIGRLNGRYSCSVTGMRPV